MFEWLRRLFDRIIGEGPPSPRVCYRCGELILEQSHFWVVSFYTPIVPLTSRHQEIPWEDDAAKPACPDCANELLNKRDGYIRKLRGNMIIEIPENDRSDHF